MSEPSSTNLLSLAHLAAVLRPAFRCPTTPVALRELYCLVVDALDGDGTVDATEAALCAVIMLRNALERTTSAAERLELAPDAAIETADSDPDIGLHLALFGVETMLERLGWSARRAA